MKEQELHPESACQNCLKFDTFGRDCWVFWERKKECSMRVESKVDWEDQKKII